VFGNAGVPHATPRFLSLPQVNVQGSKKARGKNVQKYFSIVVGHVSLWSEKDCPLKFVDTRCRMTSFPGVWKRSIKFRCVFRGRRPFGGCCRKEENMGGGACGHLSGRNAEANNDCNRRLTDHRKRQAYRKPKNGTRLRPLQGRIENRFRDSPG
jgi:hypothetical protein